MKNILISTAFLLLGSAAFGQIRDDDYKKMIDSAISLQISSGKSPYQSDIYLIDEHDQPHIFKTQSMRPKFKYLSIYEKKNRSLLGKGIKAWKVFPVLNGSHFIITIVDFTISYKNRNYNYANGGGGDVVFEYACDEKKWRLQHFKWRGI